MEENMTWRFPDNNHMGEYGLDTDDMERFKKDPDGGLAREICQNSIDANNGEHPSRVEFKLFTVERNEIPGIAPLSEAIENCYHYRGDDEKEGAQLLKMRNVISQDRITCLRVSDFNTTGLIGVADYSTTETPFFKLTKGSGTSNKGSGDGGSKGIGKFAAFVASSVHTLFYSTLTNQDECGYIGISKLRSTPLDPNDKLYLTQGTGYYCLNERNQPILNSFNLDPAFQRDAYGTDIFIIGYEATDGWKSNIVFKVLESFMAAIHYNGFEVVVDDILVNKDTLHDLIFEKGILDSRTTREKNGIIAQYELLSEEDVFREEFVVGEDSVIKVFVKAYDSHEEQRASKRIEMIRYPYMKIREYRKQTMLPYSAMCIIEKSDLSKKLRNIENPEHTEWEKERIRFIKEEDKAVTRKYLRELKETVYAYVNEVLQQNSGDSTDVEGAGEFLPSFDEGENETNNNTSTDSVSVRPIKQNTTNVPKTQKFSDDGMGYEFDEGSLEGDEEGIKQPSKKPETPPNPNPEPNPEPDDENRGSSKGTDTVLKKVQLKGTTFDYAFNKVTSSHDVMFTSLTDEDCCEMAIKQLGEANDKYDIPMKTASINGVDCEVKDGVATGFALVENQEYKLSYTTENNDNKSIEVILYAYR